MRKLMYLLVVLTLFCCDKFNKIIFSDLEALDRYELEFNFDDDYFNAATGNSYVRFCHWETDPIRGKCGAFIMLQPYGKTGPTLKNFYLFFTPPLDGSDNNMQPYCFKVIGNTTENDVLSLKACIVGKFVSSITVPTVLELDFEFNIEVTYRAFDGQWTVEVRPTTNPETMPLSSVNIYNMTANVMMCDFTILV